MENFRFSVFPSRKSPKEKPLPGLGRHEQGVVEDTWSEGKREEKRNGKREVLAVAAAAAAAARCRARRLDVVAGGGGTS